MKPTQLALMLWVAGLAAALLPVVIGTQLWPFWLLTVGALTLLMGLDALLGLPKGRLAWQVVPPDVVAIGEREPILVTLAATSRRRRTAIRVRVEARGDISPLPSRTARLGEEGRAEVEIPIEPHRRGRIELESIWLRWRGPFGLMARVVRAPLEGTTRVVPNTGEARRQAIRLLTRRDAWVGLKVVRHVGEGSEFESLREHVPGHDTRGMNWKASARHRQLINTEFRAERNHQVILAIDTGHLMREPLGSAPKLDHAISGALVLGYTGLRYGDRVGAYAFDEGMRGWLNPTGGIPAFAKIQRFTADLEYSEAETNFTLGLTNLASRLNRRSFIVLMTDFEDTVTAELMIENTARLARRHLVTFVTMRDPHLDDTIRSGPRSVRDVYRSVVADDLVTERDLVLQRLRRLGVFCIDAKPSEISSHLVNRYLVVKRRELVG